MLEFTRNTLLMIGIGTVTLNLDDWDLVGVFLVLSSLVSILTVLGDGDESQDKVNLGTIFIATI